MPKDKESGDASSKPTVINPVDSRMTFIEKFISRHYMNQPKWLRSTVFLTLTLLYLYCVLQLATGKHMLNAHIGVTLGPEELARINAQTLLPAGVKEATKPAPPGYAILYNEHEYGTNTRGELRLDLGVLEYAKVIAFGNLGVEIITPGVGSSFIDVPFDRQKFRLNSINLKPITVGAVPDPEKHSAISYIPSLFGPLDAYAAANDKNDRLFVRSISPGDKARKLQNISLELKATGSDKELDSVGLPLFGDSSIYDYSYFLGVPLGIKQYTVMASSDGGLFDRPYREEFKYSPNDYGALIRAEGSQGTTLVLQRMRPCDVVLFTRLGTAEIDEKINGELDRIGYVVRKNTRSSSIPGMYNVIYSGKDVSYQDVQHVIQRLNMLGVQIRNIQYHLSLQSPTQNQIQVGSSAKYRCLVPLGNNLVRRLIAAQNEKEFASLLDENMPTAVCKENVRNVD